jgi:hypothetical protein
MGDRTIQHFIITYYLFVIILRQFPRYDKTGEDIQGFGCVAEGPSFRSGDLFIDRNFSQK